MKKLVLSLIAGMTLAFGAQAQTSLVIFDAGASGNEVLTNTYNADTINTGGPTGGAYYATVGSCAAGAYYIGGWGGYAQTSDGTEKVFGWTGAVSTTSLIITYKTSNDPSLNMQIQLIGSLGGVAFEYGYYIKGSNIPATSWTTLTIPGSSIGKYVKSSYDFSGPSITTDTLQAISKLFITTGYGAAASPVDTAGIAYLGFYSPVTNAVTGLPINYNSNGTASDGIVVSPNPSNQGTVSITTSYNVYGVSVVNSQGIQVPNASFSNNRVNTAGLNPGVYTLLINTDNGTIAKKVVIE